ITIPEGNFLVASALGGAVGGIVSLLVRMGSGAKEIDPTIGRQQIVASGVIRPILGALFGGSLAAIILSGILQIQLAQTADTQKFFFFWTIGFVAGFSERFATNALSAVETRVPTGGAKSEEGKGQSGQIPKNEATANH